MGRPPAPTGPCCVQGLGQCPTSRVPPCGAEGAPAPRSLVHVDLPVGLAGDVVVGQAASVVPGVNPAQHQLAPGLGFRVPVGEEAVRCAARLCTRHPACGWPGWMGTGVRGSGRGESSNLTPREPQAKPLPDRRSCLGHKGSRSAPLGWPGLDQQAEEDTSARSSGQGPHQPGRKARGFQEEGWSHCACPRPSAPAALGDALCPDHRKTGSCFRSQLPTLPTS